MQRTTYSTELKEQALLNARSRGNKTLEAVARESRVSLATLKNGLKRSRAAPELPHGATQGLRAEPTLAAQPGPRERLAALGASHGLSGEALAAWCRTQGLFVHQLSAWREAFCAPSSNGTHPAQSAQSAELKALTLKHAAVVKDLARKERALAEAAALLVLQKKFQALWEDAA